MADLMAEHVLRRRKVDHVITEFHPLESDERQYCSPGFNLPVGSIRRSVPGLFVEYHTSLDTKAIVSFETMAETLDIIDEILRAMEAEGVYVSKTPYGEPQLGKRGLYHSLGSRKTQDEEIRRILFVLNYADGKHSLRAIADKAGCGILDLLPIAEKLCAHGLIEAVGESGGQGI
jgi:aminopeptidase-like protein